MSWKDSMGVTYRFMATIDEATRVLEWFRELPEQPVENPRETGSLFYFQIFGPVVSDAKKSPVVNVFMPTVKRDILTTIGEVHFLATPLSVFPGLNKISKRFGAWLEEHPSVFSSRPDFVHEWDYYLEGSVRNRDSDIYAFPGGVAALQKGGYFIDVNDNDLVLDRVCRTLELRGVKGVKQ